MSHYYSHVYNNCSIIPRLTYPLAATSLTSKQFQKLHASFYPSVISSKGFNRHFPNQLRFGMHKYSGLGLINLEVEQGIRKIQILHKFLYHPKHKTLIQAVVDWHQLSSGLSKSILQYPNQKFSYVSSIWLNNLLQFMEKNKITIVLENTLQFNIQRRNDKSIMDELTRGPSTNNQLIQLNACRLYLNIIHLSDIVYPDGKTINNHFLIGCKPPYPSSKLKWPHQKYPLSKPGNCGTLQSETFSIYKKTLH